MGQEGLCPCVHLKHMYRGLLNFDHRHTSSWVSCVPAEPFPHQPTLEEELLQTRSAAEIFGFVICGGRKSLSTVAYSFGGSKNCQF